MSSASQEEEQHSVQEFAEQYVESLVPRDERYETRLGDDFYVCTFPNGLKTWLFAYEVEGYRRRRTLGTYPEMSLTDAREALFSARKLQQAEDDLIARGLSEAVLRGGSDGAERRERVAAAPSAPAQQPSLAVRAARTLATGAAGAVLAIGGMFAYATLTTQHASAPPVASRPAPAAADSAPTTTVASAQTPAPTDETPAPDTLPAENSAATESPAAAAPPSAEQLALEAALMAVSREMLASNVIDGEPQAELPDTIELLGNETRQIYYFTEVRNMIGARLTHRWRHQRREVASFTLAEPNAYEYPLHSSMLLNMASAGDWRIELLDDAGNVLDYHLFEVVVADGAASSSGR